MCDYWRHHCHFCGHPYNVLLKYCKSSQRRRHVKACDVEFSVCFKVKDPGSQCPACHHQAEKQAREIEEGRERAKRIRAAMQLSRVMNDSWSAFWGICFTRKSVEKCMPFQKIECFHIHNVCDEWCRWDGIPREAWLRRLPKQLSCLIHTLSCTDIYLAVLRYQSVQYPLRSNFSSPYFKKAPKTHQDW